MNVNNPSTGNVEQQLESIDVSPLVAMLESLERLEKNKDFQRVILDGYIKEKALDSVSLLGNPAIRQRGERVNVMEDLNAISALQYHLSMIHSMGNGAKAELMDLEGPDVED